LPAAVEGDRLRTPLGPIPLPAEHRLALQSHRGGDFVVGVRPEAFSEAAPPDADFTVSVEVVEWLGADVFAYFDVAGAGEEPLVARLSPDTTAREGEPLALRVDAERVHLFDSESGQRIGG
ncbi:MAG TPA: TOBE domain-containing protein, partial [Longimicrobiaceae bacterium]|nr:TOBE domain-containing protein [Longimicrobiaceae bacterium]